MLGIAQVLRFIWCGDVLTFSKIFQSHETNTYTALFSYISMLRCAAFSFFTTNAHVIEIVNFDSVYLITYIYHVYQKSH